MRLASLRISAILLACAAAQAATADPAAPAATPAVKPSENPATNLGEFKRWVIAAEYAPDGATLATAGGESLLYRPGDVVVWKADGSRVGELAGHPTAVWAVRISKDGKLAATAGYDGLVKLWDYPARTLKSDLKKHKGWVRSLDFSPDGSKLATAGEDGTVIIWNTADGSEAKTISAHTGPATAVEFSPDGGTLATGGGDKLVKLWDANGNEKVKLEGHGDAIWFVSYSPDGSKLASGGADRTIKLWTTSDAKEAATFKGHKDWVTTAAFSPDGSRLASGSLDGAVKFWDVNAKGEQEGPAAQKSSVWAVAFAPDGKSVIVGTHAGAALMPTPVPKLLPPPPPPPAPPAAAVAAAAATPAAPATPPAPASTTSPAAPTTPATPPANAAGDWKPLMPSEFKSMAGATGTIAPDGTIMVTGQLAKDTYSVKAVVPAGVEPRAIKLEVLPDPSLPSQGPGRSGNGNFVLSTFAVLHGVPGKPETSTSVKFVGATADYAQPNLAASTAIDGNPATGWGISGATGKEHFAIFDIAPDVKVPAGAPLTITIDQQYADGQHNIGKFRLSVKADAKKQ
jgi:hypothetical protein